MVSKIFCVHGLWTKVASALERWSTVFVTKSACARSKFGEIAKRGTGSVQVLENTINIQSVLVQHIKVRKHLRLWGEVGEVLGLRRPETNIHWLALPNIYQKKGGGDVWFLGICTLIMINMACNCSNKMSIVKTHPFHVTGFPRKICHPPPPPPPRTQGDIFLDYENCLVLHSLFRFD